MMSTSSDPSPVLRASDADRERVATALRRHHLDGRLDTEELQERLGACYAARTDGELEALLADLPGERRPSAPHRVGGRPGPGLVAVLLTAALLLTVAAAAHGHPNPVPLIAVLLLLRFRFGLGRGPRRHWSAGGARG